ncbi:MAG TPA: TAT-variant-translocated molybdopterin oxidoreductase [Candidatus Acidoferrales bacterium]|nr:TAT-variant-translocated molybdopterin oxidoreductase [Candidatus Acidoferrales bacterium]
MRMKTDDISKKHNHTDELRAGANGVESGPFVRSTGAHAGTRRMWRSLEELADTEEYRAFLHNEFPHDPEKEASGMPRRDVLKWMAASAALAGLSGCTKMPEQKIVPYVRAPEEIIPGKPLFYATSFVQSGVATGVLVESNMGRPTKIEGNPLHPGSLGATDIFAQASILDLYDPDRSQVVIHEGRISDWPAFLSAVTDLRTNFAATKGAGLRILTETITSPTLSWQIQEFVKEFPEAKWHQWEPLSRGGPNTAGNNNNCASCAPNQVFRIEKADVIVSLDSNFLYSGPGAVRCARDFASRRNAEDSATKMNRLYVIEQGASTTGAMADHRLALRASNISHFAGRLASLLGVPLTPESKSSDVPGVPAGWIEALAKDLRNHNTSCLIVAGDHQPEFVHELVQAMNSALHNVGNTVIYTDSLDASPVTGSLKELADDMDAGRVQALIVLGGNPAYSAPGDLQFTAMLLRVPFRIHLGPYEDETAELCHWHIPAAHYLESWGDARAYDGTVSLVQPLIAPLYDGKTQHEILSALQGHADKTSYDVVREYWKGQRGEKDFETFWQKSLHDGLIAGTALPARDVGSSGPGEERSGTSTAAPQMSSGLEVVFRPDPTIGDGRWANNGWLQETPKPITKLTWDNTVQMSPATAQRLGVANGDIIRITLNGHGIEGPAWIVPGQADDSITLHLGYGRRRSGRVGTGVGFNAYELQSAGESSGMGTPWIALGAELHKTTKHYELAPTQHHSIIDSNGHKEELESVNAFERDLVQVGTIDEFRRNPKFAQEKTATPPKELSMYPGFEYTGYAWGMAIDLNKCNGCNACVVACQAENNIPVVGKEEVMRGREMHWLRVDTYFRGDVEAPETYFEPVPCMHCENAPCEGVCPVGATVHSSEGLNEMVYNRCVGTRYCSNNCPYKVRRFNFKLYSDFTTQSLMPLRNPNVSVRSRGVMEKCTYCVQRIQAAKIEAEKQDREVRDGEIVTACEAVCPAQAISFGNINDKSSRVANWKASPRDYTLLAELNTRPRTSYLARLRNPNPEMPGGGKA